MKKVIPLIILALLVVPASVAFGSSSNASNIVKPSVVLIHGAWADGSSWSRVVSLLQTHGYTVYVPPNPLHGLPKGGLWSPANLLSQMRLFSNKVLNRYPD